MKLELSTTSPAYNAMVSAENSVKGTSNTVIIYKPPTDLSLLPGAILTEEEIKQRQIEKQQSLLYSTKDSVIIDSIFKHIVHNQIDILKELFKFIEKDEYQSLCKLIITFSIGTNNALRVIRYFINSDVKEDPNNLNRNYSISSLLISFYLEKIGQQYMKDIIRPAVLQLIQDKALNFQNDLNNPSQTNNFGNLVMWSKKFADLITSQDAVDKLPVNIKVLSMFFHEIWPQDDNSQGISNFLINKFFAPALMTPELYNIIPPQVHKSSRSLDNLTILAKVLSYSLTGFNWDYKEIELFAPLKQQLKAIFKENQYFKNVLSARFSTSSYQYSNEAPMSQLHVLHSILCQHKQMICQMYSSMEAGAEFQKLMDNIPDYTYRTNYQFLTPAETKAIKSYMDAKNEEIGYVGYVQKNGKRGFVKRILVIGTFRIVTFKMNGKLGRDGHILDLLEISSPNNQQFELLFKAFRVHATTEECDHIITCIRRIYEYSLNNWPYQLKMKLKISPPSRLEAISPPDHTPTSSMVSAYKALCSYYQIAIKQTIAWYLENAFSNPNQKAFNLKVFTKHTRECPTNQELIPLIHSLRYDWFFEEFIIKSYKVESKELVQEIALMLSSNTTIHRLVLSSLSMPRESMTTLFDVIQNQKQLTLTHLDVSHNAFDEKALASFISYLQYGNTSSLVALNVSSIGITATSIKLFVDALKRGSFPNLETLNLAGNKLGEGVLDLSRWLSNEGAKLRVLNLSDTLLKLKSFVVEAGTKSALESLDLSKNVFKTKEETLYLGTNVLVHFERLRCVNLDKTMIASDTVKQMVAYLSQKSITLDQLKIGENMLTRIAVTGLISCAAFNHIKVIDLTENDLTDGGVKELARALYGNQNITKLVLNGCFRGSSGAQRSKAILALSNYVNSSTAIQTLYMRGGAKTNQQLSRDITPFLLSLGTTHSLKKLDISNHLMGNLGAAALAKAIYQNKSLSTIIYDHNNVGTLGYANIKNSLKQNYTIKEMPISIYDITEVYKYNGTTELEQKKLRSLLFKIETYLSRNQAL
ncbi:hypothetical protein CYY_001275 [Polysphondylium violaceum]|uniref:Ras-GAP domain-containing protein n=1 Tax=Polysphondylium violaceum TaxID=133409 RepID=A0A8J4Q9K9_9MYCE|nr:hypothetical protein CYY_001275 [Polysphondylium violaceum]